MLWLALALFVGMSSLCGFCGHEYRRVVDDGMVVYVAVTGTGDAGLRRLYWLLMAWRARWRRRQGATGRGLKESCEVCSCDFVEDEYATVGFGLCRSGESNLRSDEMEMISCKGIKKSGASPGQFIHGRRC